MTAMIQQMNRQHFRAALGLLMLFLSALAPLGGWAQVGTRTFSETGQTVSGGFLQYWDAHGGLTQQGYPLSGEFQEQSPTDGRTYTVQYFERAVFERHPENAAPYDVLLALLGVAAYQQKYPQGAPDQAPNTTPGSIFFPETGKRLGGVFLDYWQQHGGRPQQGYPISDEFSAVSTLDGRPYTVQYFERAVFELHLDQPPPYRVLLAQLGAYRYQARYPGAPAGGVRPIGSMALARACHSATVLPTGRVLIAGGMQRDGVVTDRAELFDPASGRFTPTGSMRTPRVCHTATLLANGQVLIAGGDSPTPLASAELYDPATGAFTPTSNMGQARDGHTATLLGDGRVLIAGGYAGRFLAGAELYDPATGQFTPSGGLSIPRSAHTATLLADGRVLVAGGSTARDVIVASAELYDPASSAFAPTGPMTTERHKHAAVRLADGRVLIAGGADARDWNGRLVSAELYDPATGAFTPTGSMSSGRFKFPDALALLPDGRALVAGGGTQAELYDPAAQTFQTVGRFDAARFYAVATRLPDGRVLITGGYDYGIQATARAWLYQP